MGLEVFHRKKQLVMITNSRFIRKVTVFFLLLFGYPVQAYSLDITPVNADFYGEIYKDKLAVSSSVSSGIRRYHFYNNNPLSYGLVDINGFDSLNQPMGVLEVIDSIIDTTLVEGRKGLISADFLKDFLTNNSVLPIVDDVLNRVIDFAIDQSNTLTPVSTDDLLSLHSVRTDMLSADAFGTDFSISNPYHGVLFNRRATDNYNAPALRDDLTLVSAVFAMAYANSKSDLALVKEDAKRGFVNTLYCGLIGATTTSKIITETFGDISTLRSSDVLLEYKQNKDSLMSYLEQTSLLGDCNTKIDNKLFDESYSRKNYWQMLVAVGSDELGARLKLLQYEEKLSIVVEAIRYINEIALAFRSLEFQTVDGGSDNLTLSDFPELMFLVTKSVTKSYIKNALKRIVTDITDEAIESTEKALFDKMDVNLAARAKRALTTLNLLNVGLGQLYGEIFTPEKIFFDLFLNANNVPVLETNKLTSYIDGVLPLIIGGEYDAFFSFDDYDKTHHIYPFIESSADDFALLNQPLLVKEGYAATISSDIIFNELDINVVDFFNSIGDDSATAIRKTLTKYQLGKSKTTGEVKWFLINNVETKYGFNELSDCIKTIPSSIQRVCYQADLNPDGSSAGCDSSVPFVVDVNLNRPGAFQYELTTEIYNGSTIQQEVTQNISASTPFKFYVLPKYNPDPFISAYHEGSEIKYNPLEQTLFISKNLAQALGGFYRLNSTEDDYIWQIRLSVRDQNNDNEYVEIEHSESIYFTGIDPNSGLEGIFIKIPRAYFNNDDSMNVAIYDPVLSAYVNNEHKDLTDVIEYAKDFFIDSTSVSAFEFKIIQTTNGVCGSSSGENFPYIPDINLCSEGHPSDVSSGDQWVWNCEGFGSGTSSQCSANKVQVPDVSIDNFQKLYDSNTLLEENTTIYGNVLISGGTLNLNGHSLRVYGHVIHESGTLDFGGGKLIINGDYRSQTITYDESSNLIFSQGLGSLKMMNEADYMLVKGDFVIDSRYGGESYQYTDYSGNYPRRNFYYNVPILTAGVLEIKGNFQQLCTSEESYSYSVPYSGSWTYYYAPKHNFNATGSHKVILSGNEKQIVNFESPGNAPSVLNSSTNLNQGNSHFNTLEITNTSTEGIEFGSVVFVVNHLISVAIEDCMIEYSYDGAGNIIQINSPSRATYYQDADNDGHGNPASSVQACTLPAGYVSNQTDCDDSNSGKNPDVIEICNGYDDNCDGAVDERLELLTYYQDLDGDEYGDFTYSQQSCAAPDQYVLASGDCDDSNASINPGANESCNNIDDNCNSQIDEGVLSTFYLDSDSDGYGNIASTIVSCSAPSNYVANSLDCNDTNSGVSPVSHEQCNEIDDDCDGQIDEHLNKPAWYLDKDQDGYGDINVVSLACYALTGHVNDYGDCDDDNIAIYPGAEEVCNEKDDNCDGVVDENHICKEAEKFPWEIFMPAILNSRKGGEIQ